jgi:fluoroacetyl-CoA thioesterase
MLDSRIQAGIESEKKFTITDEMGTGHTGTIVLSTPAMIGHMEGTCLESVAPFLGNGEATVGIHVCVSHVAASVSGEEVTVRSRITEVDRRKITFAVSAHVGDRLLGEGTHKRAVISTGRFG